MMASSLFMTSMAIATVSALFARMNAMVANQPLRKARSASGRAAITLLVAKITWMWKSFTRSPKRSRMRALPFFSMSKALEMSATMASVSWRSSATYCACGAPRGAMLMPLGPQPCSREVSLTSQ